LVTLRVEGLSFSYPSVQALRDVSITVRQGSFVGIIGPNGAGKSTLLKCLANILQPRTGTIMLDGRSLRVLSHNEIARLIAVVLTNPVETLQMTVSEILSTSRYPYMGFLGLLTAEDLEAIEKAVAMLNITDFTSRRASELSDGQRQRVMLARALAQEPSVLLLDEPTSHLDLKSQIEILDLMKSLSSQRKLTVIATFHDINLASLFSDQVVLMKDGMIVGVGEPDEVITEFNIAETYSMQDVVVFPALGYHILASRKGNGKIRIHVVAGGGTGPTVFRALSRLDVSITSGVLHQSEIDYITARAVCQQVIAVKPHMPIDSESLREAKALVEKADIIVDTGFPVSVLNEANLQLLTYGEALGKRVVSFRNQDTNRERVNISRLIKTIEVQHSPV
jgi:iron complex transport system ATP-binding protein